MKKLSQLAFTLLMIISLSLITGANTASAQSGDTDTSGSNGNSCVTLDNNLRYRMRDISVNNEVSDLQDYLIAEGYLSGNTTGYFGVATLKAVKSFQAANGLLSSGYVGPVTRAKIKALSCSEIVNQTGLPDIRPYPIKPPVMCTMEARMCPDGSTMYRDANCGWHTEMCKVNSSSVDFGPPAVLGYKDGDVIQGQEARITYYVNSNGGNSVNIKGYIDFINVDNGSTYSIYDLPFNIGGNQYNWYNTNKTQSVQGTFSVNLPVGRYTPVLNNGKQVKGQVFNVISNSVQDTLPTLNLLTPIDIEKGNPITSIKVGGYMNVCWKYSQQKDDVINVRLATISTNSNKGENNYILGSANLSQNCYVISIPGVPSGTYMITASNQNGTLNSNSPSFKVMNVNDTPASANAMSVTNIVINNDQIDRSMLPDLSYLNSKTLSYVDIAKGAYQSVEVRYSCGALINPDGTLQDNYSLSGNIMTSAGSQYFSCPSSTRLMKGGADTLQVANIVKDNDRLTYIVNTYEGWNTNYNINKNYPVGELYFYGIGSDGSKTLIKNINFLHSIKG